MLNAVSIPLLRADSRTASGPARSGTGWQPPTLVSVLSEEERKARLAYAIRTARERRGMTPPQLAARIGRGRGTVNSWESGESVPSLLDLGPLCAALQVDPRLFADLPPIPPSPVDEYLVGQAVAEGVEEGRRRAARPRVVREEP
jgi:transcriptional regulator with XRE-family HTH domain